MDWVLSSSGGFSKTETDGPANLVAACSVITDPVPSPKAAQLTERGDQVSDSSSSSRGSCHDYLVMFLAVYSNGFQDEPIIIERSAQTPESSGIQRCVIIYDGTLDASCNSRSLLPGLKD